MFVCKSATAPACYRPGEFDTEAEAENTLILAGYEAVHHPAGRVFIKAYPSGRRTVVRVVEK